MSDYEKTERILKAFGDKSRLEILNCVQKDIANPGDIAKKLDRHRSTIEKHLRVLLRANLIEKVPSLTESGQLSVRYKARSKAVELLAKIQEICKEV